MSFGSKLKEAREDAGLSQLELAKQAGLQQNQVKGYEEDRFLPNLFSAILLADTLRVSLDYLTEREKHREVWRY